MRNNLNIIFFFNDILETIKVTRFKYKQKRQTVFFLLYMLNKGAIDVTTSLVTGVIDCNIFIIISWFLLAIW